MGCLLGVDGGGTKTHCVVASRAGALLGEGRAPSSLYEIVGREAARAAIELAVSRALAAAAVGLAEIDYAVLGLSGADTPADLAVLDPLCRSILPEVPLRVVNDGWIGLRAAVAENWGVAVVCGTGAGVCGRSRDGREVVLRNKGYELGNRGGGGDLVRDALHAAFRAEEGTAPATLLEREIPRLVGLATMAEMTGPLAAGELATTLLAELPKLVFALASRGDAACQRMLIAMGRFLGEVAGGVARRLGLDEADLPVALVGSLFKGENPLLVDELTTNLHRFAPRARIVRSAEPPVMGALLLARDEVGRRGRTP